MKMAVAGLGYVGLSNAVLLAQQQKVAALDISESRVQTVNNCQYLIINSELKDFLATIFGALSDVV